MLGVNPNLSNSYNADEGKSMEELKSSYVIDKLKAGTKVTCVNFTKLSILDCGGMTIDQLLNAINDSMCLFFVKTETTE